MLNVPADIISKTTKCRHSYSCLESGQCGDDPMCDVDTRHGENVVCIRATGWRDCPYHLDFGGAKYCVCPVRCWIHQRKGL